LFVVLADHHQVVDRLNFVQSRQTLAPGITTNCRAFRVRSQPIEHVNRHCDTLIRCRDEVMWTIQTSFDIPKQMFTSLEIKKS
jgi:hypothetical protein